MLSDRDDYEFLAENALKRVDAKGEPYPVRSQKLVVTGEDEAYLREAILERRYIRWLRTERYEKAILRITEEVLRAKWLHDELSLLLSEPSEDFADRTWMDKDGVEDFGSVLPQGPAVAVTGEPTYDTPEGIDEAIEDCDEKVADARKEYEKEATSEADSLVDDVAKLFDRRDENVKKAEDERDEAAKKAQERLESALRQMKASHEAAVEAILAAYQKAADDPDADVGAARRKRDKDLLDENNRYETDVSARRDKARLEKAEAEDECRRTAWNEDSDLYDAVKERVAKYAAKLEELAETRDEAMSDAIEERNEKIDSAATSAVWFGYTDVCGTSYSNAAVEMEEARREIEIDRLCLDKYLRKTPLLADYDRRRETVTSNFVAHAPSADATMRAYADLERMRCCSVTPPKVYRNAFSSTMEGRYPSYHDETPEGGDGYSGKFISESTGKNSDGETVSYDVDYSDTSFSVFLGRRMEVEMNLIYAVYATVRISRHEQFTEAGDIKEINKTIGFMRVKLENEGVQCESDLEEIDEIRDELAETLEDHAKDRDDAYKEADRAYYLAYDEADKECDDALAAADEEYDDALADGQRQFMSRMESAGKTFNTKVANAEEGGDIDDAERRRRKKAAADAYSSAYQSAMTAKANADSKAEKQRQEARDAAMEARSKARRAASEARDKARDAADEKYDNATRGLAEEAEDEIDEIKKRPDERRKEADREYRNAVSDAADTCKEGEEAAYAQFNEALYSLTVGGETILPDHPEYIEAAGGFPGCRLTEEALAIASKDEKDAWRDANDAAYEVYEDAWDGYYEAVRDAEETRWNAKKEIQDIREDARCRWTFTPDAIDSDRLPTGTPGHSASVWMDGIVHFDVVYEPKSLTGADFSDYYEELDGDGEKPGEDGDESKDGQGQSR